MDHRGKAPRDGELKEALQGLHWAFVEQPSALFATWSVAFVWFSKVVPALQPTLAAMVPSSPSAALLGSATAPFAVTAASVHTIIVGLGLASGKDLLLLATPGAKISAFMQAICLALALCWTFLRLSYTYQVQPLHSWASTFYSDPLPFAFVGALTITMWFACGMLLPHAERGLKALATPLLHAAVAAAALTIHLSDASSETCIRCFGFGGAAALISLFRPQQAPGLRNL
jgi:hypothetical protein